MLNWKSSPESLYSYTRYLDKGDSQLLNAYFEKLNGAIFLKLQPKWEQEQGSGWVGFFLIGGRLMCRVFWSIQSVAHIKFYNTK